MTNESTRDEPRGRAGMREYRKPTLSKVGLLRDLTQRILSEDPPGDPPNVSFEKDPNNPNSVLVHF